MHVFKTTPEGFIKVRKKLLFRSIPLLIVAGAAGMLISNANTKGDEKDINVLPIVIPTAALALGFGLYRGTKRQQALYESFTLTITDNLLKREQLNTPTIWLYFNDVNDIIKHSNGGFIIKGKDPSETILVPADTDKPLELETVLQSIHPITAKNTGSFLEKNQSLSGFISVGLMVCVYTLSNKWIVGITGTAAAVLMVWSLVKIQKNKNIDEKTKRNSWLVLLVLASVIATMFFKLTGLVHMQ